MHLPGFRELQCDTQFAVVETVVAHHALLGVVVEHQPVGGGEVFASALKRFGGSQFVRFTDHFFQARIVVRVRSEQAGVAARLAPFLLGQFDIFQFLVLQHAEDADDGLRVVIGARQILRTQTVGFEFLLAPVA